MGIRTYTLILAAAAAVSASAADFFDTSKSDRLLTIGARIGVNTAVRTIGNDVFSKWNKNYWGTGFELGATADIHFRDYLSVQPGVFFQTRSGDHAYVSDVWGDAPYFDDATQSVQMGRAKTEYVQIGHSFRSVINMPVLCRFHFNVTDQLRWSVDAGPYVSWIVGSNDDKTVYWPGDDVVNRTTMKPSSFDFGFKLGTGLTLKEHYYFGIHYMGGFVDAWKQKAISGSNMAWTFTLGYDF